MSRFVPREPLRTIQRFGMMMLTGQMAVQALYVLDADNEWWTRDPYGWKKVKVIRSKLLNPGSASGNLDCEGGTR